MPKKKANKKKTAPRRQKKKKGQARKKKAVDAAKKMAAKNSQSDEENPKTPRRFFNKILPNYIDEMFGDETGTAWVQYTDNDQKLFSMVNSKQFKDFVRALIISFLGRPQESWMTNMICALETLARRTKKKRLGIRSVKHKGDWYYQISPTHAVRIGIGEWEIVECPTIFRTYEHQEIMQVDATASADDIKRLKPFLNMKTAEKELFLDTLPAYMIPSISKPISLAQGPPDSAKSTVGKLMKKIIDPCDTGDEGSDIPKDEKDWVATIRTEYFPLFDNVGELNKDQQDRCCRIVTGTSFAQREYYTNFGVVRDRVKCQMGMNGVDIQGLQSDFLDRALIWDLELIDAALKVGDEEFAEMLHEELPKIRASMFCILAEARRLEKENEITSDSEFRLRDFSKWATACAMARGRDHKAFVNALGIKVTAQRDESIRQNPIIDPIIKFMSNREKWEGTATELLNELKTQEFGETEGEGEYEKTKINYQKIPKTFPKSPEEIGHKLKYGTKLLRYHNIKINRDRGKKRQILLSKLSEQPSKPSKPSTLALLPSIDKFDNSLKALISNRRNRRK